MRKRESALAPSADERSAAAPAELAELRERLLAALADLPSAEREAVTLCHMAGLTQQQASAALGITLNTIKSHSKRGLERLRRKLEPQSAGLEAYLATVAIPIPAQGWEVAMGRWRDTAQSAPIAPSTLASTAGRGLAAVTVPLVALVIAWLMLDFANTVPAESGSTARSRACSPIVAAPGDPLWVAPRAVGIDLASQSNPPHGVAAGSLSGDPFGPSLTPPTTELLGRTATLPPGRNPVGSIQIRAIYYEAGPIYARWTEVMTASGAQIHGSFTKFRLDGTIWETCEFQHGLRQGPFGIYQENGALRCQGEHHAGRPSGCWTWFHESAQKMAEGSFEAGEKQHVWRAWHENGQLQFTEPYERGKRHGLATYFDEQGRRIRETTWRDGEKLGPDVVFVPDPNPQPPEDSTHTEQK